jgi:hypothetical protein
MVVKSKRGRKPLGPKYVQDLQGSAAAKKRAQVILETLSETKRVQEACAELGISESRLWQLREQLVQAAVDSMEARPAGRPRKQTETELDAAEVEELEQALASAQLREELALAGIVADAGSDEPGKKKSRQTKRRARPGWWKK